MTVLCGPHKRLILLTCCCFIAIAAAAPRAASAADGQAVAVWSYYAFPPFITYDKQGLTQDVVTLLNQSARGRFAFKLSILPRKRIDLRLAQNETGIVLFVNPSWMGIPETAPVVWTQALFADSNAIVSNVARKVDFTNAESVAGLRLGGIAGRKYRRLDELIDAGVVIRENSLDEKSNLRKLAAQRIDFMTGPETMLRALVSRLDIADTIYFSPTPLFEYTRHILISNASPELIEFLTQFVRDLPTNPQWAALRAKYGLPDQPTLPAQ